MKLLLLSLCATAAQLASARDTVSFSFGWKHRTGMSAWAKPDAQAPKDTDPGVAPPESKPEYKPADWEAVNLPHDGLIANSASAAACPDGCSGRSFLPRHVLWYRKNFQLPAAWAGDAVWLDFDGSFRNTTVWVNGALQSSHECGYTPFRIRLDNITGVKYGGDNVVAVFVDPDNGDSGSRDHGSGWWYEGGGLYRNVKLVRTSHLHIEQDGFFAYSNISGKVSTRAPITLGQTAETGTLHTKATVVNEGTAAGSFCTTFTLRDEKGKVVGTASAPSTTVAAGALAEVASSITLDAPELWSSPNPYLYNITATIANCGSKAVLDSVSDTTGFRKLDYYADTGFFLNDDHFKVRGFCDHNNFAVVGMAVPERINLFRAQASRAVGGNGRRTSHNPPDRSMLDIYDRIGIVVMDENRLFANETKYVTNMGVLVKRDRNHPSVVIWSFCNEGGCEGSHEEGGPRFQAISQKFDGTRPTLANMFTYNDLLSNTIDVQGFSHQSRTHLEACKKALPHKPIYMSECCSCNTMRDEDVGCETLHDNPHHICTQPSFNARCAESNQATNASDGVDFAVGTMVWTLFDYYGEPPVGGPEVSSTYGQYDLCGFPKAASFWYRTQWLLTRPDGPDKTFLTHGAYEVHLVESWEAPAAFVANSSWNPRASGKRAIHAYSNARTIELLVNGKSQGEQAVRPMVEGPGSYAEWPAVVWESGNLTAVAKDESGKAVATHSRHTNKKSASLSLTIDAPSVATGTGTALLLDGHDAALLRGSILDASGNVMHLATNNISFKVISGPGQVQGSGNGDPHCHEPNNAPWHSAYHGLVRAVVRVTSTAARAAAEKKLLAQIDLEGPLSAAGQRALATLDATQAIVVEASSPGFAPARVSIAVSTDELKDGPFAAASAAAGQPVDFFGKN